MSRRCQPALQACTHPGRVLIQSEDGIGPIHCLVHIFGVPLILEICVTAVTDRHWRFQLDLRLLFPAYDIRRSEVLPQEIRPLATHSYDACVNSSWGGAPLSKSRAISSRSKMTAPLSTGICRMKFLN